MSSLSTKKGNLIEEREKKLFAFNKCGEADQGGFILGMKGGKLLRAPLFGGKKGLTGKSRRRGFRASFEPIFREMQQRYQVSPLPILHYSPFYSQGFDCSEPFPIARERHSSIRHRIQFRL